MFKLINAALTLVAAPAVFLLASGSAMAADPTIDVFEAGRQAAWNAHDAAAYAAAFAPDADIITAQGWHWAGQADAARNLGDGFKFIYALAHLRLVDVQARTLTSELALVTLSWSITGARAIDGGEPAGEQHGFELQLLQRHGAGWVVLSQQDTAAAGLSAASSLANAPQASVPPTPPATFPMSAPPVRRCIIARSNGQCLMFGKPKPPSTK